MGIAGIMALILAATLAAQPPSRLTLELADFAQMPITGELAGQNTRGQLARVNFLRDEPGGRRFFVNDLNGPLYIVDKQTKTFTTYLDFNGAGGRPGLFPKFTFERNFAIGLTTFQFDPDYARNGVFYTIHMEDPAVAADAAPRAGAVAGLDLSGYTTTPAIAAPTAGRQDRSRGRADRMEGPEPRQRDVRGHGARADAPAAARAHPPDGRDDVQSGRAARRSRLAGHVHRIRRRRHRRAEGHPADEPAAARHPARQDPAHRARPARAHGDEHGQRERPVSDPQRQSVHRARGRAKGDLGVRHPQPAPAGLGRRSGAARPRRVLFAFNIGLAAWETVLIVKKGANYGYSLREGTQTMSLDGMGPIPQDDTIPVQISDTVARGTVKPTYPVIQYPHMAENGGDAIAGGFVYRGRKIPALRGKLVFGDITTGRIWYAELADVLAADDGNPATVAQTHEMDAGLRRIVEDTYRARGGKGEALPGAAAVSGRGRVDFRFAVDNDGELYILTKSDGMIRKVVGAKTAVLTAPRRVLRLHAPVRPSRIRQRATSPIPSRPRRRRSPPARRRTTPTAPPVTATWRRGR